MKRWVRVTVAGLFCGFCSRVIEPDEPVHVLRGKEGRRTHKRCVDCDGPPPDTMPEAHAIGPDLDRFVMENAPLHESALPFDPNAANHRKESDDAEQF